MSKNTELLHSIMDGLCCETVRGKCRYFSVKTGYSRTHGEDVCDYSCEIKISTSCADASFDRYLVSRPEKGWNRNDEIIALLEADKYARSLCESLGFAVKRDIVLANLAQLYCTTEILAVQQYLAQESAD